MIDLNDLRKNPEPYKAAAKKKRVNVDIDAFLELDGAYRAAKSKFETVRAEQNSISKELPKLKEAEKQQKLQEVKELSLRVKELDAEVGKLEARWKNEQCRLPSIPLERVPEGKDDSENVEIKRWGEPPQFQFEAKDHVELGKKLGLFDSERAVKIAGARNYFLKGDGARLHHAVLNFAMDLISRKGYTLFEPPHMVHYNAMMGTGYFPGGEESAYQMDERDQGSFLIGTSEVPVCSYHMEEILSASELPKRYAGYSACYRREAGTYGKDTQGLYRVHQFYKVEQVVVCAADAAESAKLHAELLGNAEELLQLLKIPYRVVDVCGGDMGLGQVYKNDIESWMPSRKGYGETHSCSTFHDFQARRLDLRYKDGNGKNVFCHTLNNTLVASPRVLIPLLELNQNADGSVNIPEVLRPYMGGQSLIR